MPLTLPTEYNVPPDDIGEYTLLIAGEKKIGKSAFCAQFPEHIILEFEPGNAKHLPCRSIDIGTWANLLECINLLESKPGYAKTIVVDDVPSAYKYCSKWVCKQRGISHPSDEGYGKAWSAIEDEFTTNMKRLHALGGVIYTAHAVDKEIETRSGRKFTRLETSCSAGADRFMDAMVHLWGVILYNENQERELVIRGGDYIKAGCGLDHRFLTPDGEPVYSIPLGRSPKEAYNNFVRCFHNQLAIKSENLQPKSAPVNGPVQKKKFVLVKKK